MDPNSNPFFSDATDFTNMLLSGLLDGLNFSDEGPENGERSPIVRETLQTDLMSRGSRTGSCSDAGSPSTMCSDDDIGATIGAKWSSASQELCQEDNGGIVLERLGSNYSRSSEGQKRKPSMENDIGSPMSSPNAIHLNADIQEAIRRASITIYQGLVRHVDRFSDSKDGNIVLCVDPTGKPSQNESSVKVSEDTSVWSDAEGAGTPLLMSPQGNLELAALENEEDAESKSLNASPQRSGGTPEELSSSPCQDAFFLDKDINPELESCSDLCKSLSPALESGLAIQEPVVGFDCTQEPSEQDRFSPTSPCLDAGSNVSPSLLTEQNAEEKADACEAFYLQDEEDSGYKPCGDLDAVQEEQFDSSRSSPAEQQDKDETTVLILADQATDLAEDKDRLSKSPGQEQLEDIEQKVTTPKSLSPTEQHRDGTPVLMVTSEGLDCEGVNSESDIRVAESLSPLSSGPQEAPMSPALISPCRDDLTEDQNGADGSLSPDQTLEAPESIPDRQAFPTATTDKDLLDQDCAEDDLVAEGGGTPSNLQRTSSQEELSRESSLSSFEEMVLHKDSGDETQQKKAPLILEEYFNAAMKKFSNTLLDALITHLDSYKDTKMGLPLPVNMKSENTNFAWGQEEDETNDAKQDGEQPSMSAFMG